MGGWGVEDYWFIFVCFAEGMDGWMDGMEWSGVVARVGVI